MPIFRGRLPSVSFLVLCKFVIFAVPEVTYSELKRLNASCNTEDTCGNYVSQYDDSLITRSCECGEYCKRFRTCCLDSPHRVKQRVQLEPGVECSRAYDDDFLFMVTRCDPKWFGPPIIKTWCETKWSSVRDPLTTLTPATNRRSGITYGNYFCAVCNNDADNGLKMWNVLIQKPQDEFGQEWAFEDVDEDKVLADMSYNEELNQWGLFKQTAGNKPKFESITFNFVAPEDMSSTVRSCIPDVISDCDRRWRSEVVRRMCHSYMAVVYILSNPSDFEYTAFRNVHCAICNYAYYAEGVRCKSLFTLHSSKRPMSFTILIDVNTKDGDLVGQISRCRNGQSYDPFFKKCRELVCALPGYKMANGMCIKP